MKKQERSRGEGIFSSGPSLASHGKIVSLVPPAVHLEKKIWPFVTFHPGFQALFEGFQTPDINRFQRKRQRLKNVIFDGRHYYRTVPYYGAGV